MKKKEFLKFNDFWGKQNLPIKFARRDPQPEYPLHTHDFSELVIVYEGTGTHFTENFEAKVIAGDAFIIKDDLPHGYRDIDNLKLINILYDPANLTVPAMGVKTLPAYHALFIIEPKYRKEHSFESHLRLNPEQLAHAMNLVDNMEKEVNNDSIGCSFIVTGLFWQLVGFFCRCYAESATLSNDKKTDSLLCIGRIISHLENHFPEPVTTQELTKIANMSERSLSRTFKKATGLTPIDYYIHLKVSHSCSLLQNTALSVSEIAYASGFSDSNYYTRQFKKIMGTSPTLYRNLNLLPHKLYH